MSLSDLQRAALAPHLWRRRVIEGATDDLDAIYDHITDEKAEFNSPSRVLTPRSHSINNFFLVPGGRYIIGSTASSLSLYDLGGVGRPNRDSVEPATVAEKSRPEDAGSKSRGTLVVGQVGERTLRSVDVTGDWSEYVK